jgi:hypothetical protein
VVVRKKKTANRKRNKPKSDEERIGKRNPDGTINMCRIDERGNVSIIAVHVFKKAGVAYGAGYETSRSRHVDTMQYRLDELFMSKDEALDKSKGVYRAYQKDPYEYTVKPVYLHVYRGKVQLVNSHRYYRDSLEHVHVREQDAVTPIIVDLKEEIKDQEKKLKEHQTALKQLERDLVAAKKRDERSKNLPKYSDVRQYVLDAEQTRKASQKTVKVVEGSDP